MEVGLLIAVIVLLLGVGIGAFVLWILMLIEVVQIPEGWFKTGTKTTWILVVVLLQGLGALIYFFAARPDAPTRAWLRQQRLAGYQPIGPNAPQPVYPAYPPYGTAPPPQPGPWQQPPAPPPGPGA